MQEKNRLFILDIFRNCVDRSANMRSFIERMGPKKAEKALCSPLPLHPHGGTDSVVGESAKREPVPDRPQGAPHTLSKRRRKTSTADADTEQLSTRTGSCQGAIISLMSDDEGAGDSSILIAPDRCRRTISGPAPSSSVSGRGGDDQREGWACAACTYSHRAQEQQYLLCAMCGTNRLALPSS